MNPCGCDNHGMGVCPGPCVSKDCAKKADHVRLKTEVIPTSAGSDAEGEAFAPKLGRYTNTIVKYQANGAIYVYDSRGIYTCIRSGRADEIERTVDELVRDTYELLNPTEYVDEVDTFADLDSLTPQDYPNGSLVMVRDDETHGGQHSLYFWSAAIGAWDYARPASPYYTMEEIDEVVEAIFSYVDSSDAILNEKITTEVEERTKAIAEEAEAREEADTKLDEKLTAEGTARTEADNNLQSEIDAIVNSTDVKDVVGTKAELEDYDKSKLGDNDIIKVLNDESEDGATTYYRYNAETQEFTLIGEIGPYYTKAEADEKFATNEKFADIEKLLADLDTGEGVAAEALIELDTGKGV